jgi:DNA invertase Pin-like site-specific DNA recombinase
MPKCARDEQPIDTGTAAGKCFLDMLGVFAEFKTNLRKERNNADRQHHRKGPGQVSGSFRFGLAECGILNTIAHRSSNPCERPGAVRRHHADESRSIRRASSDLAARNCLTRISGKSAQKRKPTSLIDPR